MPKDTVKSGTSPVENRGRIKIDLETFFKDYRRQSYILLKTSWDTVKDLKEYIEKTFEISDAVVLTSDEVYLPITETIDIVAANDELKIVKTTHVPNTASPKTFKSQSMMTLTSADDMELPLKPKRKRTHKRKLTTFEKAAPAVVQKKPTKIFKPDTLTNVSHVYYDEEGNSVKSQQEPVGVKFINFIDTLDVTKPRIIKARAIKSCAEEVIETERATKNLNSIPAAVEMATA